MKSLHFPNTGKMPDSHRKRFLKTIKEHQSLTDRERKVIIMRLGLEDGTERTLKAVGEAFKVTPERIRQIEAKAIRKMRGIAGHDNLGRMTAFNPYIK